MADYLVIGRVSCDGATVEIRAVESGGNTTFTIVVVEGAADLRGFFFDYGGTDLAANAATGADITAQYMGTALDGNNDITKVGQSDNNMNGSGETFDAGLQFGTSGIGKDDIQSTTFTINGLTLAEIDGATFGIRATSVLDPETGLRTDSCKLVGTFDTTPPEDNFPTLDHGISNVTFYFNTTSGDTKGKYDGNPPPNTPDGVYTVKIDNWPSDLSFDLDGQYDALLQWIIDNDPNVDATTEVLGVAIKASTDEQFYAIDGDPNDVDPVPDPPVDLATASEVDQSYNYADTLI
jgi:hypothetical protein